MALEQAAPAVGAVLPALRPATKDWLGQWSAKLDPRRHPSVSGPAWVSALLHMVPATHGVDDARISRSIAVTNQVAVVPIGTHSTPVEPRSMGGHGHDASASSRRTLELLAALSTGLDAAEQRPRGHAVRTALIALRMATERGLMDEVRAELLYAGLLRDAGSTGLTPEEVDTTLAKARPVNPPSGARSKALVSGAVLRLRRDKASAPSSPHLSPPDRAAAVVRALQLPIGVAEAVYAVDERWDGRGAGHLRRLDIPMGARLIAVASAASQAWGGAAKRARRGDAEGPLNVDPHAVDRDLGHRRGRELDPELVDVAIALGRNGMWHELDDADLVPRLLDMEPVHRLRQCDDARMDRVCATFADLVDTRTPRMGRHGTRVARLAEVTATVLGFDHVEARELRRAGLLHDFGKLLVPIAYLEKAAELTPHERSVVNEHPLVGASVLRRSRAIQGLAPLVIGHHEKLDGSGRFPQFRDERMELASRVIAVCDRYEAMTSERPYRPLLARAQVWWLLEDAATEPVAVEALRALRMVAEEVD